MSRPRRRDSGFFSKLTSRLLGRQQDQRRPDEADRARAFRSTRRSICLTTIPSPSLGPGDLFGEMTCMSLYPRSATVRAATDCVMFEMLRNVLDIMQRNKTLKAQLDANYRKRALDDHLRSVPLFAIAHSGVHRRRCATRVELVRYTKGDVICRQGDSPTASTWSASDSSR